MIIQRYEYCYGKRTVSTRWSLQGPCAVLSRRSELILDLMNVCDTLWYKLELIMTNQNHWPWWQSPGASVDQGGCPRPCLPVLNRFPEHQERRLWITNTRKRRQSHVGTHLNSWGLFMRRAFECRMCHRLVRAASFILNPSEPLWI